MAQDAERIRKIIAFKENLEKRVAQLETELKETQATLDAVNSILLEKGFKRVEMPKEPAPSETPPQKEETATEFEPGPYVPQPQESENVMLLKTVAGEVLASVLVDDGSMRILPAHDKEFDVNMAPFSQFLVERVLTKMQERDSESARTGQLEPDRIFSYNIVRDGNIIREISIKNVDPERLRELKSSIRWTLEKMYEKMKTQG
jgi:hypothetical protein